MRLIFTTLLQATSVFLFLTAVGLVIIGILMKFQYYSKFYWIILIGVGLIGIAIGLAKWVEN